MKLQEAEVATTKVAMHCRMKVLFSGCAIVQLVSRTHASRLRK